MRKKKLLVADDDVFFQGLIEGLLAPDYDVIVARDGNEAWHELQQVRPPRLVILDWVMPGLSGPQICRQVRASENLSSTYIILLTARNNESDIIAGLNSGADDYITKPPLPAELRARIKMGERVLALQDAVKSQALIRNRVSSPDPYIEIPALSSLTAGSNYERGGNREVRFDQRLDVPESGVHSAVKPARLNHNECLMENYHSKQ